MNEAFFATIRQSFGPLTQSQVDGMNALLAATDKVQPFMRRAYMLATAWWETAKTMQPIEEYGKGAGRPYAPIYYGRGYVQLTWRANYLKAGNLLGFDLVNHPELALQPNIAAQVMLVGMTEGWFTGKKLSDYTDYVSMRRIINGTDHAADIALIAHKFEAALTAGVVESPTIALTAPTVETATMTPREPQTAPAPPHSTAPIGLLQAVINLITMLFARKPKP